MIISTPTDLNLALVKALYPFGLAHKSKDITESFVHDNKTLRQSLDTHLTDEPTIISVFRTVNNQMV